MATIANRNVVATSYEGPRWSAVWAGTFAFIAIWSVFGLLGEAIFASAASPNSANTVGSGIGWGMGIWSIILTMIAMYVAGRVTAEFSGVTTRHDAMLAGMTMFGLSVTSTIVLVVLAGSALAGGTGVANAGKGAVIGTLTGLGWAGFVSLFLGWLCAMWGASSGVRPTATRTGTLQDTDNIRDLRAA
jgi:hypothetical protein